MKAKTHLSQNKSRGGFTLVEMLVVISMIAALAGISFPAYRSIQKRVDKQQVLMMYSSVERAVDNFETEYNYLPYIGAAYPASTTDVQNGDAVMYGGDPWGGKTDITNMMTTLVGLDGNLNFKKIRFLECQQATPFGSSYKNGLHDNGNNTVTLYDSFGYEFVFMKLDYNGDGIQSQPLAGGDPSQNVTGKKIIMVSVGQDGAWGGPYSNPLNDDNVKSWEP
jgi:prepilin-type N-terminal cleavage/methylation domain-containing protein